MLFWTENEGLFCRIYLDQDKYILQNKDQGQEDKVGCNSSREPSEGWWILPILLIIAHKNIYVDTNMDTNGTAYVQKWA